MDQRNGPRLAVSLVTVLVVLSACVGSASSVEDESASYVGGPLAVVGGGSHNSADVAHATVGGGSFNRAGVEHATVGGGLSNTALASRATIGGGYHNTAVYRDATVGGGSRNTAAGTHTTIGGGAFNSARGRDATVAGGYHNIADVTNSTVGGGSRNAATGFSATIGGGAGNVAAGAGGTVGGGVANSVTGADAVAGGGYGNTASGSYATVPGGLLNAASADHSFAAGHRAVVDGAHVGAFLYADSTPAEFGSAAPDEFAVRATGGVRLVTGVDEAGAPIAGAVLSPGSGSWSSLSDLAAKRDLSPVNGLEILARVADLPLSFWGYLTQGPSVRHIGPSAQDFYAAFGVGEDDRHISMVDADGVALAAIQGLYSLLEQKDDQIAALEARVAALEQIVLGAGGATTDTMLAQPLAARK